MSAILKKPHAICIGVGRIPYISTERIVSEETYQNTLSILEDLKKEADEKYKILSNPMEALAILMHSHYCKQHRGDQLDSNMGNSCTWNHEMKSDNNEKKHIWDKPTHKQYFEIAESFLKSGKTIDNFREIIKINDLVFDNIIFT